MSVLNMQIILSEVVCVGLLLSFFFFFYTVLPCLYLVNPATILAPNSVLGTWDFPL